MAHDSAVLTSARSSSNGNGNGSSYDSHSNGNGNGNGTRLSTVHSPVNGNGNGSASTPNPIANQGQGKGAVLTRELAESLAEVKGQSQFLLYLADQIEESLGQLDDEDDDCQAAFLCKVLTMYASQLESKHRAVGEKIGQACGQVYSSVRDRESR